MQFKNRLLLYGFGFILGSIVVVFIWNKKDASFDYMPEARVLKNIHSKKLITSNSVKLILTEYQIDSLSLTNLLNNSEIDFNKSNTKSIPCKTYWVNTIYNTQKLSLIIENCDSIATIQQIIKE
jgi:hypothetical protein